MIMGDTNVDSDGCNVLPLSEEFDIKLANEERILFLNGDIDEYSAGKFTRLSLFLRKTPDPVYVIISSVGGRLDCAKSIIRAIGDLRKSGCTVIGEVRGYAMSAGAIILQHCDIRYAGDEDIIMMHGLSSATVGDVRDQEEDLKLNKEIISVWADFLMGRNTSELPECKTADFWVKILKDASPKYYLGKEALEKGLIDGLI